MLVSRFSIRESIF